MQNTAVKFRQPYSNSQGTGEQAFRPFTQGALLNNDFGGKAPKPESSLRANCQPLMEVASCFSYHTLK